MSKNIVYLFGAGSSFNSVPIISTMTLRMRIFVSILREFYSPIHQNYFDELEKLINEIDLYKTPDTLIRKLYLSNESEIEIKNFLTSFFIFEQLKKTKDVSQMADKYIKSNFHIQVSNGILNSFVSTIDNRYLGFLTTIAEKKENTLILPGNISILSWNYDMQLERAFQEINNCDFNESQNKLNVFPQLENLSLENPIINRFNVLKLNGTAGFYIPNKLSELFDPKKHSTDKASLDILLEILISKRQKSQTLMHFAWESNNERVLKARQISTTTVENADAVVVIGYSFPDFNRSIDKEIFKSIPKLKRIYIQDPNAESIKQKLNGINPNLVLRANVITDCDSFVIPIEFWE